MGWLFFVTWAILFLLFVVLNVRSVDRPNLLLSLLVSFLLPFLVSIATYEINSFDKALAKHVNTN